MKNKISIITTLVFAFLLIFVAFNVNAKEGVGVQNTSQATVNIDEHMIVGNTCGTVSPDSRGECCERKGFEDWDVDINECVGLVNGNKNNKEGNKEQNQEGNTVKAGEQQRNTVANAVQAMVHVADRNGGVGKEVRVIAQNQLKHQESLEGALKEVEGRKGFASFLIGPKYKEVNKAKALLDQNIVQIRELNQLKNKLNTQADKDILVEQISFLEQLSEQARERINGSENKFSLFGWAVKLFTK